MKRILCLIGIHNYGKRYNKRGGGVSNNMLLALVEALVDPRRYDQKCERCGKVKTTIENVYEKR